ncbi:uncharacterized protein SCHCODRAFT_02543534 [Schizophyllum commune H4-8]|nr:uncharacterized protein SCHCODRAFT_02543534 [Schizophyllum commune H4-8]KAI5890924.1 hypothetical protein SCHCODRAFT_02543534 [Schizophyllum commune H4-8]
MSAKAPLRKRARIGSPPPQLSYLSAKSVTPTASLIDRFPNELWYTILKSCSAADLCCLRTAHPHLRTLVDDKKMRLLKEAFRGTGLPSFSDIEARWPEYDLSWFSAAFMPTVEDNATAYILMMCGGRCSVCDAWTGAPPFSSNLCVRLCGSSDCTALMFSNAYSRREGCSEDEDLSLPTEASYWLPYLHVIGPTAQPPSRGSCVWYGLWPYLQRRDCRYLLCNIRQAFDELSAIDGDCRPSDGAPAWSLSACPQSDDIDDLLEKYGTRAIAHEAMETIFLEIAEWRQGNQVASAPIREANLHTLRTVVNDLHMDFGLIRKDPLTQRVLAAHARDLALVYPSTFLYLSPPPQSGSHEDGPIVQAEEAEATVASSEDLSDGADASAASSSRRPSRLIKRRAKPDRKARKQCKLAQARFACSECLHTQFTARSELDRHMSESHGESTSSSCCVA